MTETEDRLRMRRGSSMSDIDKIALPGNIPDLVRSSTANHKLSASPASVPHSPYLSRLVWLNRARNLKLNDFTSDC